MEDLEKLIDETILSFNNINKDMNDTSLLIEKYEKDIKDSVKTINEIKEILNNTDTLLFKYSSATMKGKIFRDLTFNKNKHQNYINKAFKEKTKAQELHIKYLKLLRCVVPDPLLECKVCFEMKKKILAGPTCGHLICNSCYIQINKIQRHPKCPTCMATYNRKPIRLYT